MAMEGAMDVSKAQLRADDKHVAAVLAAGAFGPMTGGGL